MSTKPTFDELVAWAQEHAHESIRKGKFDQAIWEICERVARWRYEQDADERRTRDEDWRAWQEKALSSWAAEVEQFHVR